MLVSQKQAERHHAEQETAKKRVIDHAVVGDRPGKKQGEPVPAIPEEALAGPVKAVVLRAPEAEQEHQRDAFHRRQPHMPVQALLYIGAESEGQRAGKGQPAPHLQGAQRKKANRRVEHRDQENIQVEYQRKIIGKQPCQRQIDGIQHTVIGIGTGRGLIKRPAQQPAAAESLLDAVHAGNAVAAIQERH